MSWHTMLQFHKRFADWSCTEGSIVHKILHFIEYNWSHLFSYHWYLGILLLCRRGNGVSRKLSENRILRGFFYRLHIYIDFIVAQSSVRNVVLKFTSTGFCLYTQVLLLHINLPPNFILHNVVFAILPLIKERSKPKNILRHYLCTLTKENIVKRFN